MKKIFVRPSTESDHKEILQVATSLSGDEGWFDDDAINSAIPTDLMFHKALVAEKAGKIVGFLMYSSHNSDVFISWLGVTRTVQGNGIGTRLIQYLENELINMGIRELKVDTLSESIDYDPYSKTRAFYEKMGFIKGEVRKVTSSNGEELELVTYHKKL